METIISHATFNLRALVKLRRRLNVCWYYWWRRL